jgi:hypothetical protein
LQITTFAKIERSNKKDIGKHYLKDLHIQKWIGYNLENKYIFPSEIFHVRYKRGSFEAHKVARPYIMPASVEKVIVDIVFG